MNATKNLPTYVVIQNKPFMYWLKRRPISLVMGLLICALLLRLPILVERVIAR